VDPHVFVLGGSLVSGAVANVLSLPTLTLAARSCPRGLEATLFAVLMAAFNVAEGVRFALGAALTLLLGVGPDSFERLPALVAVCTGALLLPLPLLARMPADIDGSGGQAGEAGQQGAGGEAAGAAVEAVALRARSEL
jgi:hypothetical protein